MANSHSAVTFLVALGATGIEPLLPARQQMAVGHSGTAGLFLDDSAVSRRHALITFSPCELVSIHDLNCAGGTFVNNERITRPRALRAGGLVKFADLVTRFEVPQPTDDGPPTSDLPATELPIPAQARPVPLAPAWQVAPASSSPVMGVPDPGNARRSGGHGG